MDVFGEHWQNHFDKVRRDWLGKVAPDDAVLLPGDISWAMTLAAAMPDLFAINALPGKKILLRGNHDYWWHSLSQLRAALPQSMFAIQNDAVLLENAVVAGTRGWTHDSADPQDEKVFQREVLRLELSLKHARNLSPNRRLIVMMHYPPIAEQSHDTPFTRLISAYDASDVVYGHLHGTSLRTAFHGSLGGVRYHQVSCDRLNFELYEVV